MSKRTFQPNNRRRAKTHGFRLRMRTRAGRAILSAAAARAAPSSPPEDAAACSPRVTGCVSADFAACSAGRRAGATRAGSRLIVVHANRTDARAGHPPRVGFVVSKAVGDAVVRNRTKRGCAPDGPRVLARCPPGTDLVVRANPPRLRCDLGDLGADLDRAAVHGAAAPGRAAGGRERAALHAAGASSGCGARPVIWLLRALPAACSPRCYRQTCRFYPSCSAYAITALDRFGLVEGGWLAARRLGAATHGTPGASTTFRRGGTRRADPGPGPRTRDAPPDLDRPGGARRRPPAAPARPPDQRGQTCSTGFFNTLL